tara:strand:- start:1382 stop:4210 length:2829 start_codon:yes stop_codon:yes gene_type:complete
MKNKENFISIHGARVHNLKNISVDIPRNKLVVFTGKSGSGKSSLAFNTIYAEGQRRYLETFNAYARQFLGNMDRPDVDEIKGLSPVVAIEQKTTSRSPRSTVGTITEIYDYLRLLYARIGIAYSYNTGEKMVRFTDTQILKLLNKEFLNKKVTILAPIIQSRKGNYADLFKKLLKKGYLKVRVDGEIINLSPSLRLDRYKTHDIELIIDRLIVSDKNNKRVIESLNNAMSQGEGVMMIMTESESNVRYFSKSLMCPSTGLAYSNPEPNSFSFNSPKGACKSCNGLGKYSKVDLNKIVPNKKLSIHNGAIVPINNKRSSWILKQLKILGKKYNFSLNTPFCDINEEAVKAIFYGVKTTVKVKLESAGISQLYNIDFEGLVNFIGDQVNNSGLNSLNKWGMRYMSEYTCKECNGSRLNLQSSCFKVADKFIGEIVNMDITSLSTWITSINGFLDDNQKLIAEQIIKELSVRVRFILDVGLSYLSLNRSARTLSGGEAQRIRLATQIGTRLTNVLYILDEPSIGLHQRDNLKLISSLKRLRDIGNSVIVVEHDKEMIENADFILDLGPGAGINGGQIIFKGHYSKILEKQKNSIIYQKDIGFSEENFRRKGNGKYLSIIGATGNNLKSINIDIPLGLICCVTGVSGSGKSTLINETLFPVLNSHFFRSEKKPLPYKEIKGIDNIDKVVSIDQSPIGRTPRSNPATYTGLFSDIRSLFASLPESKIRGYKSGRFSFNISGGRCETCNGGGMKVIEMNFLPNILVHCDECNGYRYNHDTLEIYFKGKNISEVLSLTVDQAVDFFKNIPSIYKKIKTLQDVGLGYISLGQSAVTFSGGEAQRIKLSTHLSRRGTGNTLYILDEPTTGLHFTDIQVLLKVINKLVDKGNTILIIEHNIDVIKASDYVIDIGPDGGFYGGNLVCQGVPEIVAKNKKSYTGQFLKKELFTC